MDFFLSAPIALLAAALAPRVLPRALVHPRRPELDAFAAVLSLLGLAALTLTITRVPHTGFSSPGTWAIFAAAVVFAVFFVIRERSATTPLVPVGLLRVRTLLAAIAGMPGQVFAFNGTVYLALLYFQQALGYGPVQAGLVFGLVGIGAFLGSAVATRLLEKRAWSPVVAVSLLIAAGGLTILAVIDPDGASGFYLAGTGSGLLMIGFGVAVAAVTLNAAVGRDVPQADTSVAYGLFETSTHISAALCVAVLATVVSAVSEINNPLDHVGVHGVAYRAGFAVAAGVAVLAAAFTVLVAHQSPTRKEEVARYGTPLA